ncbi:hypothetical protein GCM10011359_22240 [Nesterenkonia alkaliphila]|nr:hypothetical protein GCM10011359_22240 [Nesterenkonia alkaliphila]
MRADQVDKWRRPSERHIHSRPVRRLDSCHEVIIAPPDIDLLQRKRTIFTHDGDARTPGFGCEINTDKEHHGSLPREQVRITTSTRTRTSEVERVSGVRLDVKPRLDRVLKPNNP